MEALKLHVMIVVSIMYGSNSCNIRVSFNATTDVIEIEIEISIDFLPLQLDSPAGTGFYIQHEYNVELDFDFYLVHFHSAHDRMPWVVQ